MSSSRSTGAQLSSIRVQVGESVGSGDQGSIFFFTLPGLESAFVPDGFLPKLREVVGQKGDSVAFPGIVEAIHSSKGNISTAFPVLTVVLFTDANEGKFGLLLGVPTNGDPRVLGVTAMPPENADPRELKRQVEERLLELLEKPEKFKRIALVTN